MEFGSSGKLDGQFRRPTGVAVDKDGDIYVVDWGNDRLQMFNSSGNHLCTFLGQATISKWGKMKLDANSFMWKQREIAERMERERLFRQPIAVEVDARGRVFVLERGRHRIQVYTKS